MSQDELPNKIEQEESNVQIIAERMINPENETTILRVEIPEKGIVCRVHALESGVKMVAPIEIRRKADNSEEPYFIANDALISELKTPLAKTTSEVKAETTGPEYQLSKPYLLKNTTIPIELKEDEVRTDQGTSRKRQTIVHERAKIYGVGVENPDELAKIVEENEDLIIVPKSLISGYRHLTESDFLEPGPDDFGEQADKKDVEESINLGIPTVRIGTGNEYVDAVIHPDCELLIQPEYEPRIITGEEDLGTLMNLGRKVLKRVDEFDRDTRQPQDRLTMNMVEQLKTIIPDKELAEELEQAYIKERLVTIGVQQIATAVAQGGITQAVISESDLWTNVSIAGAIGIRTVGNAFEGKTTPESFDDLLNTALVDIVSQYDVKKSGIGIFENDVDNKNALSFARDASNALSEGDAMKSKTIAKWGSVATTSVVALMNGETAHAAAFGALGVVTNVLGEKYRKKLEQTREEIKHEKEEVQKKERGIKDTLAGTVKRAIKGGEGQGSAIQTAGEYLPNVIASMGLEGKALELAVHMASFSASNEILQASTANKVVKRTEIIKRLNDLIEWAQQDASELVTDEQYSRYAAIKTQRLIRERPKPVMLANTEPRIFRTQKEPTSITINPVDVLRVSQGEGEKETKRYKALDNALGTLHNTTGGRDTTALLLVDQAVEYPGEKTLLDKTTFLFEKGKLHEISGKVSTPIMKMIAEQRKSPSVGTTYIRTPEGDVNVHLDNNREQLRFYNCDGKEEHIFFEGQDVDETIQKLAQINFPSKVGREGHLPEKTPLFTEDETRAFINNKENMKGKGIGRTSRVTERKLAIAEALSTDHPIVVINYPFRDLELADSNERILVAEYLATHAQERVVVFRTDSTDIDYKKALEREGKIETYDVVNAHLERTKPTIEQIMYTLEEHGITQTEGWDESLLNRLANEVITGVAKLDIETNNDGQESLLRIVDVARGKIIAKTPTGTYQLKQKFKTEPTQAGIAKQTDRSGDEYSLYRSLRGTPEETMKLRLREMEINADELNLQIQVNEQQKERKESDTYPGVNTEFNFFDMQIEVPEEFYEATKDKEFSAIAQHESGGFTYFEWVKIEEE